MPNWCENQILIRGSAEEIKRYKDSLLKVGDKYYPFLSTVPLPELKDESEVDKYIEKEHKKTLWALHRCVIDLEVIENGSEELKLHLVTVYTHASYLGVDLFPKLSILHKYLNATFAFHGFMHYVKGEVIASGHENGEEQDPLWQMYDYNPWPFGLSPLEERLKNYTINPQDLLRSMEELDDYLKKEEP